MFFFDESRFGTHSKLGHGWFEKGSRTQVKIKLGFDNFYLYGAVSPASGQHISLILPNVNTQCMNIFLQELAIVMGNKKIFLVLDGAGWHKSKRLVVPATIKLIYLPAYSPELNPIERLWLHIKQHTIKNKLYSNLQELKECLCRFVNDITTSEISSICALSYLDNYM